MLHRAADCIARNAATLKEGHTIPGYGIWLINTSEDLDAFERHEEELALVHGLRMLAGTNPPKIAEEAE